MEELALVLQQAQEGNKDAYGEIVRRFQDMAVGYAYGIVGNFALAEDAAQEAFIEAYGGLGKVYGPAAFPGWLRRIVFKYCDRLSRRDRGRLLSLDAAGPLSQASTDALTALENHEVAQSVRTAITALSEPQRRVITLFYISDYSQKEIATFLEVPLTTVQKRLHDARKRLKERMTDMVKEHLHDNRPSKDGDFAHKVLLREEFDDPKLLNATWGDFPELGAKNGLLDLNYRYRGAIDTELLADLKKGELTNGLRRALEEKNIELSAEAALDVVPDPHESSADQSMWVITDRPQGRAYRIRLPWFNPQDRDAQNELWVYNALNYDGSGHKLLVTRRRDFDDFSMSVDFCIVSLTVGLTLRAQDERNYYCVQIDLRCLQGHHDRKDKPCIEFAVKSEKRRIDNLVMWTEKYPQEGEWRHMKVEARGYDFALYLGENAENLEEIATWSDSHRAFRRGAIGFWQDVGSGESACFRNLQVTALD